MRYKPLLSQFLLLMASWLLMTQVNAADNACLTKTTPNDTQAMLSCKRLVGETDINSKDYPELVMGLAKHYLASGDLNAAQTALEELLPMTQGAGNQVEVQNLRQLGIIYFRWRRFEDAFNQFEKAIKIALLMQDQALIALSYNDLANIYQVYGDLETSVRLLLKSYEIHLTRNNKTGQASVLNNLGAVYRDKGDYDEAIVSYRRAYSLLTELDQPLKAALTLSSLGVTFDLSGNRDKAIALLTQAADIFKDHRSYRYLAYVYLRLAEIEVNADNLLNAQAWVDESNKVANLVHSSEQNPRLPFIQGLIWSEQGNYPKAIEAFEQARQLLENNREYKLQQRLYTAMAEVSEKTRNFEASSQYWRKYAETLNSQLTLKDAIGTARLQTVFSFSPAPGPSIDYATIGIYALISLSLLTAFIMGRKRLLNRGTPPLATTRTVSRAQTPADTEKAPESRSYPESTELTAPPEQTSDSKLEPPPDKSALASANQMQPSIDANRQADLKPAAYKPVSLNKPELAVPELNEHQVLTVRTQLVELMHQALQMWEESTQSGKLELAQQSKIWSVGIDDGRLRARAMERYFSLNTLPQKPRWRSVVRTCNFVLQKCQGKSLYREDLETNLKDFQEKVKRTSLISSKVSVVDSDTCRTDHQG